MGCMRIDMRFEARRSAMACVWSEFEACHLYDNMFCRKLLYERVSYWDAVA